MQEEVPALIDAEDAAAAIVAFAKEKGGYAHARSPGPRPLSISQPSPIARGDFHLAPNLAALDVASDANASTVGRSRHSRWTMVSKSLVVTVASEGSAAAARDAASSCWSWSLLSHSKNTSIFRFSSTSSKY